MHPEPQINRDYRQFAIQIKAWAVELGFADARIGAATLPPAAEAGLAAWLVDGCHGEMDYMARHGSLRARPTELVPGTLSIVSVRLRYWPSAAADSAAVLADGEQAYLSRYALGRDYHKTVRQRLQKLAERIAQTLTIPVIGIGAGRGADGQVLVLHDMLGIDASVKPRFVKN